MKILLEHYEESEFENRIKEKMIESINFKIIEEKIVHQVVKQFDIDFQYLKNYIINFNNKILQLFSTQTKNLSNLRFIVHKTDDNIKNIQDYAIQHFLDSGLFDKVLPCLKNNIYDIIQRGICRDIDMGKGCPDLICFYENSKDFIMVEIKTNCDGLRKEQFEWVINHPTIQVMS